MKKVCVIQIKVLSLQYRNKQLKHTTMTNAQILNEKLNTILGLGYTVETTNGLTIKLKGYKMCTSLIIEEVARKAGEEIKKEIATLCLKIKLSL